MKELTFKFETDDLADEFLAWLSNSGEQDFYQCMQENEGIRPALDYWAGNDNGLFGPVVFVGVYTDGEYPKKWDKLTGVKP